MIHTRGFELVDWQRDAVEAWGTADPPYRGTFEIFTGGGKSLVALECARLASELEPALHVAIVVPTEALAKQWLDVVLRHTDLTVGDIGLLGAGGSDALVDKRVLVAVLNTAAKRLPEQVGPGQPAMLIVDECHRAGAPTFSRVLSTPARYRLGLSATPEREEFDEAGEPLDFDEQLVGRRLGPVVYRFGLRDARAIGWLPEYRVHHHGISLTPEERIEYDKLSRRVDDAADDIRDLGGDSSRAQQLQRRDDDLGRVARNYIALTASRKDLLYRATERERVAGRIVGRALRGASRKVLLFHERVDQAESLAAAIADSVGSDVVALEHSRLPDRVRSESLARFRSGEANVLVSVKSLVEGIDVPDAEIGVSVAASSSVRQRIQSLGRVLRRRFDADPDAPKRAEMHLIYVADTVDESIYSKEDWGDITGEAVNDYWRWPLDDAAGPERMDGPPATPRPTEAAVWARIVESEVSLPQPWEGSLQGQEYSVDTMGNVVNRVGTSIANPQGVDEMVASVRGRPGGRFRVTPDLRLVLVTRGDGEGATFVAGRLNEAFEAAPEPDEPEGANSDDLDVETLRPGDAYPGPTDKSGGSYSTRAKRGGVIERKVRGGAEFALLDAADDELVGNAERLLDAWRTAVGRGVTFHVNEQGHAWYTEGGTARFLARVPGGFAWPAEEPTP